MLLAATLLFAGLGPAPLQDPASRPAEPPVELGRVAWGRRLEPALKQADNPVLLLFQEIPG